MGQDPRVLQTLTVQITQFVLATDHALLDAEAFTALQVLNARRLIRGVTLLVRNVSRADRGHFARQILIV